TQPAPNRPPQAPTNLSPPDGSANQPLTLILQASAFSDPDADSHESSQWIVKRSSDNTTVLDSGDDTANKTSITVPTGVLSFATSYSWSVAYKDSKDAQSPPSTPTIIMTQPTPNRPPQTQTNLSPPDGSANQPLTLTLQSSAFNDPDRDIHSSPTRRSSDLSDNTTVLDSGADTANKTSITVPTGVLSFATSYSWSVAYKDSK